MNKVNSTIRDGIEIIAIDNPPVNALSHQVRTELVAAVERAGSSPDVVAIIIFRGGAHVSGGGRYPRIRKASESPVASRSLQ